MIFVRNRLVIWQLDMQSIWKRVWTSSAIGLHQLRAPLAFAKVKFNRKMMAKILAETNRIFELNSLQGPKKIARQQYPGDTEIDLRIWNMCVRTRCLSRFLSPRMCRNYLRACIPNPPPPPHSHAIGPPIPWLWQKIYVIFCSVPYKKVIFLCVQRFFPQPTAMKQNRNQKLC